MARQRARAVYHHNDVVIGAPSSVRMFITPKYMGSPLPHKKICTDRRADRIDLAVFAVRDVSFVVEELKGRL